MKRLLALAAFLCLTSTASALAADPAAHIVHLLDYIAVDYPQAVVDGRVKDEGEYREMAEFAASVRQAIARMPDHPARPDMERAAEQLAGLVAAKASATEIGVTALGIKQQLIGAYAIAIGPRRAPDLGRAATLYAEHCGGCHGAAGRGDGPLARGMDPEPSDFTEGARQAQRSVHGLYNTITLGVAGTAMRAFPELPEGDRWALAYLASTWGAPDGAAERGRVAWAAGRHREAFRSQADIAGRTAAETRERLGTQAAEVLAFLRANPAQVSLAAPAPIEVARERIRESAALHAAGRTQEAVQASLSAYLDGFELAESALATVDAGLVRRIEAAMFAYRNALATGTPARVADLARALDAQLAQAAGRVGGTELTPAAAGIASFLILLREGLEAVLVVTALLAVVRRGAPSAMAGGHRAARYLHAGWIAALAVGVATWAAATWIIDVSGAAREITEGVTALAAAAMLLYVGFWLHDKSHAGAWRAFILDGAASRGGTSWGLAAMAFLAVYREVFETVLFYQALWLQAPGAAGAILAGFAAAVAALALATWAILRYSVRLPLRLFFGASGLLLAALAVVLAGSGVAALQEAGAIPVSPVEFITISWLGVHPTLQALATQLAVAALVVILFAASRRRATRIAEVQPQET